jgi:hypothetical protein
MGFSCRTAIPNETPCCCQVDNEFFVPHGYLSDEEAGEDEQAVLSNRNRNLSKSRNRDGTVINYGSEP